MSLERLRRQDGLIRDGLKYLALFVVVLVLILDTVSVIHTQSSVRTTADQAGRQALTSYTENGSDADAEETARLWVEEHDSRFLSFETERGPSRADTAVTVTAERTADTYVFRYFTYLPWGIGDRIDNMLSPTVRRTTAADAL